MFYNKFDDNYEERLYAYTDPKGWIDMVIDYYLDGMDQEEVQKEYEYSRDVYENGLVEQAELDPDYRWEYESYIKDAMEKYEEKLKQHLCKEPIISETYKKKHQFDISYIDTGGTPFEKYYVLSEKDSGAIVFAAEEWYTMKNWLIGKKFLK